MNIPAHIRALIDGALGADGYYGVFTANMDTDSPAHPGRRRDRRGGTATGASPSSPPPRCSRGPGRPQRLVVRGTQLHSGTAALPCERRPRLARAPGDDRPSRPVALCRVSRDGQAVPVDQRTVKGISYVAFDAVSGDYVASYSAVATGAGTGATGGSAPQTQRRPKVSVKLLSKRVSKRGTIAFRVSCPAASPLQGRHRPKRGGPRPRAGR